MDRVFKPAPIRRVTKYHIVLTFQDNGETYYVVKYYGIYKQWWHYEVWDADRLDFEKIHAKVVKHREKK